MGPRPLAIHASFVGPVEGDAPLGLLLGAEESIGATLTEAFQIVPEASTSAIVVHHPQATYYMVRE